VSDTNLIDTFMQDHRACDQAWAKVESAADPVQTRSAWENFHARMLRHFDWEEGVVFPAFEQATGMTMGPTMVMRSEHDAMRGLMDQMKAAMDAGDVDEVLDQGDTLLMLIQQHNMKEEQMLYPMMQQHIGADWEALRAKLRS